MKILIDEPYAPRRDRIAEMCHTNSIAYDVVEIGSAITDYVGPNGTDYDLILIGAIEKNRAGTPCVITELRTKRIITPIIVLCPPDGVNLLVASLNAGADGAIYSPLSQSVLHAYIVAVVRRSQGHASPMLRFGDLSFEVGADRIFVGKKSVHLTNAQRHILEKMMLSKMRSITHDELLQNLYSRKGVFNEPMDGDSVAKVHIYKIRRMLKASGSCVTVKNLFGRGYALVCA